jgi:hypothetical protein
LDKADDFETFYVNSLTSVEEMSDEEIQDNKEDIVYIYQSASDVYADDLDQRIEVLEKGYELTGQDSTIQSELAGSFVEVAKNCAADDDVDGELGAYGDALDVDSSNAAAISGMSDCLNNEISTDIDNGDLEAAEALINEYENSDYSLNDVDFAGYRTKIEDQRAIIDQRNTVMQSAYNYMSAKDYESMNELDGSTEADEVAYNITDYFIYSENGAESKDYTGTAVAIFKFSDGYCFYYGDLVDGKREGTGSYFMSSGSKYEVYEGAWSENLPNGSGTYTEKDASAGNTTIDKVTKGTFTDGLQNGSMSGTVTYNGNTYTGSWTATNGKAPDVSANYPDYDFSSVDSSYIIYAVFSPTGSDNYFFYSYKKEDDILGIFGIDY